MTVVQFSNRRFKQQWRELTLLRDAQSGLAAAKDEIDALADDLIERIAERFPREFSAACEASVSFAEANDARKNADAVRRAVMPVATTQISKLR